MAEGEFTKVEDHAEQMVAHLIEYFRKPRNSEIVRQVGSQVQDIENVIWQLFEAFDVDNATGATLDLLGAIVGERRDDRLDPDFRAAVRARILVNSSDGTIEDMLAVIKALAPSSAAKVWETYPAAIRFDVYDAFSGASPETMARMLRQAKPAGVRFTFIPVDTDETMIWGTSGADLVNGWGADWAGVL